MYQKDKDFYPNDTGWLGYGNVSACTVHVVLIVLSGIYICVGILDKLLGIGKAVFLQAWFGFRHHLSD